MAAIWKWLSAGLKNQTLSSQIICLTIKTKKTVWWKNKQEKHHNKIIPQSTIAIFVLVTQLSFLVKAVFQQTKITPPLVQADNKNSI